MEPLPNYEADAGRVMEILRNGGIVIIPSHLGYAIVGSTKAAMDKMLAAKRRVPEKIHGFTANLSARREIHDMSDQARRFVSVVTEFFDLPLGVGALARLFHPLLQAVDPACFQWLPKKARSISC